MTHTHIYSYRCAYIQLYSHSHSHAHTFCLISLCCGTLAIWRVSVSTVTRYAHSRTLKKTIADPELNPIQLYKEVRLLVDALKDGHHLVPPPLPPPPLAQQSGILPPLPPPMVRASSASSASSTRDAANDKGGYAAVIAELQAGVTLKQTGLRAPLTAGASLREQERNQAMTDETVEGTLRIALEQRRLAVKDDEI